MRCTASMSCSACSPSNAGIRSRQKTSARRTISRSSKPRRTICRSTRSRPIFRSRCRGSAPTWPTSKYIFGCNSALPNWAKNAPHSGKRWPAYSAPTAPVIANHSWMNSNSTRPRPSTAAVGWRPRQNAGQSAPSMRCRAIAAARLARQARTGKTWFVAADEAAREEEGMEIRRRAAWARRLGCLQQFLEPLKVGALQRVKIVWLQIVLLPRPFPGIQGFRSSIVQEVRLGQVEIMAAVRRLLRHFVERLDGFGRVFLGNVNLAQGVEEDREPAEDFERSLQYI